MGSESSEIAVVFEDENGGGGGRGLSGLQGTETVEIS